MNSAGIVPGGGPFTIRAREVRRKKRRVPTVTIQGRVRPLAVDKTLGWRLSLLTRAVMLLGAVMTGAWLYRAATDQDPRQIPAVFQPFMWLARTTGRQEFELAVTFGWAVGLILLFGAAIAAMPLLGLVARHWPGGRRRRVRVTIDPDAGTFRFQAGPGLGKALPIPEGVAFVEKPAELQLMRDDAPKRWNSHSGWNYYGRHLKRAHGLVAVYGTGRQTLLLTSDLVRGEQLKDALDHALQTFYRIVGEQEGPARAKAAARQRKHEDDVVF